MSLKNAFLAMIGSAALVVAATVGGAAAEPLVVYSPQGGERGAWIAEQAKAAGIEIKIVNAGGGELFDRLLAERNNPQADVVLGLVDPSMARLKSAGLFTAFTPAWANGLPQAYKDKDGQVFKFWQTPIVVAYNADKLPAAEAPKSWLDLTQDRYKGKYVIGDLAWQTTRVYLAGILARFLDDKGEVTPEGWAFMKTLYANATVVNDANAKTAAFKSGAATVDLNWFGGAVRQGSDLGYAVKIVDTAGGTPFIAEGIAIMKDTKKLDQAKAFVNWFGAPEFMAAYATKWGQTPAHPKALELAPEKIRENARLAQPQPIDWDAIAPKMDLWMQKIELEIR